MRRFVPYLGIVASLVVALLVAVAFEYLSNKHTALATTTSTTSATLTVLPDTSYTPFTNIVRPENNTASHDASSSEVQTVVPSVNTSKPHTQTPTKQQSIEESPQVSQEEITTESASVSKIVSSALVNIICIATAGSGIHSISGSGTIVSSNGYVLTNAHVGEYFLLKNKGVNCVLRTGSPAKSTYEASLVFISPTWLKDNADILSEQSPSGTGEHDIAILAITDSISQTPLPQTFPFVPIATAPPEVGTPVIIGSYGAQFLQNLQVTSELFPTITTGSVKKVYTFKNNTVDVIDLGGSAAAQEGSSGGAVTDLSGNLTAMITTSTITGPTSSRSLNAITASYVRGDYASETGTPLETLLATNPATATASFASSASSLEAILFQN